MTESILTAGVDEAGRGCLAGPVVAAAVLWPDELKLDGLTDSKALNAARRESLRDQLEELLPKGHWAIGMASPEEIDDINILQATYLAMHRAIEQLHIQPELLLIDGNRFKPFRDIAFRCEVKGDARFQSISAASIFAKTERDLIMLQAHTQHPQYAWNQNKGYPSPGHKAALAKHGETEFHRKSFKWRPSQLSLDF